MAMINQQVLEGNWNQLKGKIERKWGQLSDSDLSQFRGNVDELIGTIQQKTGEGREAIEGFLQDLTERGSSAVSQAAAAARDYAGRTTDSLRGSARYAASQFQEGVEGAQSLIYDSPGRALAISFGVGLLVGWLMSMTFRSK
jgi:uncharacterized protein YjbJ (UPF0337 family)